MDLVVQATPASMSGVERNGVPAAPSGEGTAHGREGPGPGDDASASIAGVDPSRFGPGQLVVDLVYDPALTPFLIAARRKGATVRNGLGMLVHQAARQIRIWTGEEPPVSDMWGAVADQSAFGPIEG